MGKTIIDLTDSEATITNPSQYYIETQKIGDSITKRTLFTKVITYLQTLFAPKFVPTNTATGASSVTINATSGVAVFTSSLGMGSQNSYTINNNLVSSGTYVSLSLKTSSTGVPMIAGYYTTSGVINIRVYNADDGSGDATDADWYISFELLN